MGTVLCQSSVQKISQGNSLSVVFGTLNVSPKSFAVKTAGRKQKINKNE